MSLAERSNGHDVGLEILEAEARYARERYQLYRALAYRSRSPTASRLRELERASQLADARLRRAKARPAGT
jgi:hypothetical protein